MQSEGKGFNRREFIRSSALAGLGVWAGASWPKAVNAASKDRVTILSSVSISSLDPYAFSSSPEYGIWNHMAESLVEVDYVKMDYVGVLAESWEFQGTAMGF
jgi:ABC-type transport system substrate-binding protein